MRLGVEDSLFEGASRCAAARNNSFAFAGPACITVRRLIRIVLLLDSGADLVTASILLGGLRPIAAHVAVQRMVRSTVPRRGKNSCSAIIVGGRSAGVPLRSAPLALPHYELRQSQYAPFHRPSVSTAPTSWPSIVATWHRARSLAASARVPRRAISNGTVASCAAVIDQSPISASLD
jgi:hypothetical protein